MTPDEKLALLAPDLTQSFPRSPRDTVGGFVVAARTLDKCRAILAGTAGEYHFDCPLDRTFFDFAGVDSTAFKDFVTTGATDGEVADWLGSHAKVTDRNEILAWNNKMRHTRPADMTIDLQVFLEGYIAKHIPRNRPVYVWFDVYDLEEQRI